MNITGRLTILLVLCLTCISATVFGQVTIEGYVFEDGNRGYLNLADVEVLDKNTNAFITKVTTNKNGVFVAEVAPEKEYILRVSKKIFATETTMVSTVGKAAGTSVYVKVRMKREPGYRFEVTLASKREQDESDKHKRPEDIIAANGIHGATIEVYNNTKDEKTLELIDHQPHTFAVNFEQGNHYTLMVRQKGFFVKRMEAFVNVEGCILCFDGVEEVSPGAPNVADALTEENKQGTLIANVNLQPIKMGKSIKIKNIYYKKGSSKLNSPAKAELDKLAVILRDNASLLVEIGSHTDSQGDHKFNQQLSERRANGVVRYLISQGVGRENLIAKGYGESKLRNRCKDGVECSDRKHARNRRTELKVVGTVNASLVKEKSLFDIKEEEKWERMLKEVQSGEQVEVQAGEAVPYEIKKHLSVEQIDEKLREQNGGNSSAPVTRPPANQPSNKDGASNRMKIEVKKPIEPNYNPSPQPTPSPTKADIPKDKVVKLEKETSNIGGATNQGMKKPIPSKMPKEEIEQKRVEMGKPDISIQKNSSQERLKVNTINLRKVNQVPLEYTGYKVEFFTSPSELPQSHEIFSRHGNIFEEQRKDGSFGYLLGDFKAESNAYNFLNSIMKGRYPSSRVIEYINGRRKN